MENLLADRVSSSAKDRYLLEYYRNYYKNPAFDSQERISFTEKCIELIRNRDSETEENMRLLMALYQNLIVLYREDQQNERALVVAEDAIDVISAAKSTALSVEVDELCQEFLVKTRIEQAWLYLIADQDVFSARAVLQPIWNTQESFVPPSAHIRQGHIEYLEGNHESALGYYQDAIGRDIESRAQIFRELRRLGVEGTQIREVRDALDALQD